MYYSQSNLLPALAGVKFFERWGAKQGQFERRRNNKIRSRLEDDLARIIHFLLRNLLFFSSLELVTLYHCHIHDYIELVSSLGKLEERK